MHTKTRQSFSTNFESLHYTEETYAFIREHKEEDIKTLALKAKHKDDIDFQFALQQIDGYQSAKKKLPSLCSNFDLIYPVHLSMEQCSSEKTALYKSSIVDNGSAMADLTGGFGIDFYYISQKYDKKIYVEQNSDLCDIAKHNFNKLNLCNFEIHNAKTEEFLQSINRHFDLFYIDPARRDKNGSKTFLPSDCTPDLTSCYDQLMNMCDCLLIKYSPLLDISLALKTITHVSEIHIVSLDNECKELLFKSNKNNSGSVKVCCVNIRKNCTDKFVFDLDEENNSEATYTNDVFDYIYEPNASILKAGAFNLISSKFGIKKLHKNSHLYTSDKLINDFPGRTFKKTQVSGLNKNDLKSSINNLTNANITIRNYPSSVDALRKKLRLKEGGNTYIFATTNIDNKHILIFCEQIFKE